MADNLTDMLLQENPKYGHLTAKAESDGPEMTTGAESPSEISISFVGMGLMGTPMATNLARAGFDLTVWNRTPARTTPPASLGAKIASSAPSAAAGADVLITMLPGGPAVEDLLFDQGVAAAMKPNATVVDMSSIPPHSAVEFAGNLSRLGIAWLDAPVSGGTKGAESGTLTIMVGGEFKVFERCGPVFEPLGRATHVGNAGAGQITKLANQIIVAATIGGVAEALLLAKTAGLDLEVVRNALSGGFADSRVLTEHGRRMTDRDWAPGGMVELQLKDLNNALAEAGELGLNLPLTANVTNLFRSLAESGESRSDHSALLLELERINSLA